MDKERRRIIKGALVAFGRQALPEGGVISTIVKSADTMLSNGGLISEQYLFLLDYPFYNPDFLGGDIYGNVGKNVGKTLSRIRQEIEDDNADYTYVGVGSYSNAFKKLSKSPPSNVTIGQILNPENAGMIEKLGVVSSGLPRNLQKELGVSLADVPEKDYKEALSRRQSVMDYFTQGNPNHFLNKQNTLPQEWSDFLRAYTDNDPVKIEHLKTLSLQSFYDTEIFPLFLAKLKQDLKRIFSSSNEQQIANDLGDVFDLKHLSTFDHFQESIDFAKEALPEFREAITKGLVHHRANVVKIELKSAI